MVKNVCGHCPKESPKGGGEAEITVTPVWGSGAEEARGHCARRQMASEEAETWEE